MAIRITLPVHGELVSTASASRGQHAQALRKVIFKRLQKLRRKIKRFPRPPLPCPYPCAWPLAHLSPATPRVPAWTGRPCHSHALRDGRRYHSTPACAMAVGARSWFERPNLILQPIQPSPARGSTWHVTYLALPFYIPAGLPAGCGRR